MLKLLYIIENEIKWPGNEEIGYTTLNIGIINSGIASNIVPNKSEALLLFRCVTNPLIIENKILKLIKKYDINKQIEYKRITMNKPLSLHGIDNKYNPSIIPFNTDIPYFNHFNNNKCKIATIFGPGNMIYGHTDNEQIKINELIECVDKYIELGLECMNQTYDDNLNNSITAKL